MMRTNEFRLSKGTWGLTLGWLAVLGVTGVNASCRPDLSLGEMAAGMAGESGDMVGGSSGNGGSAGTFAKAGRGGSTGSGGSAGKGGPTGSGGTAGKGAVGVGGSINAGGSSTGGTDDMGGSPGSGGTSSNTGGTAPDAEGGSPSEGGAGGTAPSPSQAKLEEQTISRWNAVADHRPPNEYVFHWIEDKFPHPTYGGGYPEGYHEFGLVLDVFLDDHFEFLAQYHQFLTPYYYVTESPADVDAAYTWDELATFFSTSDYGELPSDVKQRLAQYAADMKAYE